MVNIMLEKIEVNDENIRKIAMVEVKKQCGIELNGVNRWVHNSWIEHAVELLNDYNRVVEILNGGE